MAEFDYLLEPNSERDLAAARLRHLIPVILQRWEVSVRLQVTAAQGQDALELQDDVPGIVEEVSQALAIGTQRYCEDSPATRAHALERVTLNGYSLGQVIQEYALLREVILDRLHDEGFGNREVVRVVNASLDQSVQEAAVRFSSVKEEVLRASELQHRLLVDGVKDYALVTLDLAGRVVIWNSGARRVFGYEDGEILGDHFGRFFPAPDGGVKRCEQLLRNAHEREKCEIEGWWLRNDGTQFWAEGAIRPLQPNADGRAAGYSLVTRDITERKYLEEQLLQKAEQLARADERKSEFLAMLAHELRTPLSAITSATYLLENICADDRAGKQLLAIGRQTRQLRRLVEDLMDVSRIRSGKVRLKREAIEIGRIARNAAETVRLLIEGRGQTLHCSIPADRPLLVRADPERMEQVVTNLLNNACKYTDPGGAIWLEVERADDDGLIRVRDSGRGIDPPQLPSIFDLFAQIEPDEREGNSGLGIGLALVKKLVELHGGSITASSDGVGHGAEFMVRLPLLPPTADGAPSPV